MVEYFEIASIVLSIGKDLVPTIRKYFDKREADKQEAKAALNRKIEDIKKSVDELYDTYDKDIEKRFDYNDIDFEEADEDGYIDEADVEEFFFTQREAIGKHIDALKDSRDAIRSALPQKLEQYDKLVESLNEINELVNEIENNGRAEKNGKEVEIIDILNLYQYSLSELFDLLKTIPE